MATRYKKNDKENENKVINKDKNEEIEETRDMKRVNREKEDISKENKIKQNKK